MMPEHNSVEAILEDFQDRITRLEEKAASPTHPPEMDRLGAIVDARIKEQGLDSATLPVGQVEFNALLRVSGGTWGWSDDLTLESLLAADADALSKGIGGLAHPVRIALYKALIAGPKESAELLDIAGLNTTGQLYHHLQAMADVGLVERRGRNLWASENLGAFTLLMAAGKLLANWRGPDHAPPEGSP